MHPKLKRGYAELQGRLPLGEGAGEVGTPERDTGWTSSFEGIGGPGGWLRAIARILGEMLDIKADNLTKMAEKMANDEKGKTNGEHGESEGAEGSKENQSTGTTDSNATNGNDDTKGSETNSNTTDGTQSSATVEYQAAAKEFSIAMEACVNAIKTLGDACNTAVRK